MRLSDLRHRVVIQRYKATQDEYGQPIQTWIDVAAVWANVEGLSGRELFEAQQTRAEADHRVTIRYRDDITPTMRIVNDGRSYNITAAADRTGRREWLELTCKEAV